MDGFGPTVFCLQCNNIVVIYDYYVVLIYTTVGDGIVENSQNPK